MKSTITRTKLVFSLACECQICFKGKSQQSLRGRNCLLGEKMVTKYDKIIIGAGLYGLYSSKYSEDKTERVLERVLKLEIEQNIYFFSFFYEIRKKMEAVN